jgi:hypothetical protein
MTRAHLSQALLYVAMKEAEEGEVSDGFVLCVFALQLLLLLFVASSTSVVTYIYIYIYIFLLKRL